jgi:cell wall-associated NlpC family hydrolase
MRLKELQPQIQDYCKKLAPQEACGLILKNDLEFEFVPCENIAVDKETNFKIADTTMLKYSKDIYSIFHSHVEGGTPAVTLSDIKTCEAWGCIGSIVFLSPNDNNICSDVVFYGKEVIYKKLTGRPYYYNVFDCFTMIRDFYYTQLNIDLKHVYSDYGWWEHTEHKDSLYLKEPDRLNLVEIDIRQPLQVGDILSMKLGRSKCINHGSIYVGNNKILHHLEGKLSCTESFGKYGNRVERGLRYNPEIKLLPKQEKVVF